MREVTVATDGSCISKPGPGGWPRILRCGEQMRVRSVSDQETTSDPMELMAAIAGLRALKAPCRADQNRADQPGVQAARAQAGLRA